MKRSIAILALALAGCRSAPVPEARADSPPAAGGVAVLELFTSEGCSSCPPADAVATSLATEGGAEARGVFVLAFHVDYWDELGWPDRFASPDFTSRQRAYARALGARGVYTPQMIAGGVDGFTGSDRGHAEEAIARALSSPAPVRLALHPRAATPGSVTVDFETEGATDGAVLRLALVEGRATTDVRAGENAGRTLVHTNVVRTFVTVPLAGPRGTQTLAVPPGLPRADASLVGYVQRPAAPGGGMPVLGAARARLPP